MKTNRFQTLIYERQRMEWRLVLRKPTPFQPSYLEAHGCNDDWFCKNQPRSNLLILMHMVGITVGFTKTNSFPTLEQERQRLDWWLVLRKPTAFRLLHIKAYVWNNGWFYENQPSSNRHVGASTLRLTVGFAKTFVPTSYIKAYA